MTGTLTLEPSSGTSEGGEIWLSAPSTAPTSSGIILDNNSGSFRIFGKASKDGVTVTGTGATLNINPYSKTITGGYTMTGTLDGNAKSLTGLTATVAELNYTDGVTSNIQTQLNGKLSTSGGTFSNKLTSNGDTACGLDNTSYNSAPFIAQANYYGNNNLRAGYGFHNQGVNGIFLYLDIDAYLKHVNNDGEIYKVVDSRCFSLSDNTLTITI